MKDREAEGSPPQNNLRSGGSAYGGNPLVPDIPKLTDFSLNTVVKIENGVNQNPTIETLTKIAKALEVGVDDLIK